MTNSNKLLSLSEFIAAMQQRQYRSGIAFFGERDWGQQHCCQLLEKQDRLDRQNLRQLWLGDTIPEQLRDSWLVTPAHKAANHLGEEFDTVVYQGHDGFDPNALGAITGTIKAAGLFILLLPAVAELEHFDDPEKKRICSWPYQPSQLSNLFLLRFYRQLAGCADFAVEQQGQPAAAITRSTPGPAAQVPDINDPPCKTVDQAHAVTAILHVVRGHRRRPLVISADRGRGKSASLGIAAARLLQSQKDLQRILVTAPRPGAVTTLFEHASRILDKNSLHQDPAHLQLQHLDKTLEFLAPDIVCRELPACHLLIVDEAAAIPTPLLENMLRQYPRIVFATTIHGYEGNGRGFAVRFRQHLNTQTPQWRNLVMETPIRYPYHDPLEQAINHCLLLASASDSPTPPSQPDGIETGFIHTLNPRDCDFVQLSRQQLLQDETTLAQLFSLLVLAHYQTQPRDLRFLMDARDVRLYTLKLGRKVVAVCLCQREGGLDTELADDIYHNTRRVQGHVLPQTLCAFSGLRSAGTLRFVRIIRIAVHPDYQRQGLASRLLEEIELQLKSEHPAADLLGANFGYAPDLLNFWQRRDFVPIHLGYTASASSGAHALTLLKALSSRGEDLRQQAVMQFARQFPYLLSDRFKDLDSLCALSLLRYCPATVTALDTSSMQRLADFSSDRQGIDGCYFELQQLLVHRANRLHQHTQLSHEQKQLLLCKILQKHSWQQCCSELGITGKKQALSQLRQAVQILLETST